MSFDSWLDQLTDNVRKKLNAQEGRKQDVFIVPYEPYDLGCLLAAKLKIDRRRTGRFEVGAFVYERSDKRPLARVLGYTCSNVFEYIVVEWSDDDRRRTHKGLRRGHGAYFEDVFELATNVDIEVK